MYARRTSRARGGATLFGLLLTLALATTGGNATANSGYAIVEMQAWATSVDELVRGPQDIGATGSPLASYGTTSNVIGSASGAPLTVLSLGDGGSVTLQFAGGIGNGPGDDFAVYENGFWSGDLLFAELAFVEVSSNGVDFARFDAVSQRLDPVGGGETVDPDDYYNLAGNQPIGIGSGFDLAELSDHPLVTGGLLNLWNVTHVRLVDVIGDGSTSDANASPVWDPYPTDFTSSGFDLDAVGVRNVPEPGAFLMLAFGGLALAGLRRLRRRRDAARRALRGIAAALAVVFCLPLAAHASWIVDFEDLGLGIEDHVAGPDVAPDTSFTSNAVEFQTGDFGGGYWYGFAGSTHTDQVTGDYTNDYAAWVGGGTPSSAGAGGSDAYGVFYYDGGWNPARRMVLPGANTLDGAYFTNTTYGHHVIEGGNAFSDPFGGAPGEQLEDFLLLTVTGFDAADVVTGVVEFYLADYRFADDTDDYIVDDWTWVDLSGLGVVKELEFVLSWRSDLGVGQQMAPPAYFAMDDLTIVPEPGTALLFGAGLVGLARRRRAVRR